MQENDSFCVNFIVLLSQNMLAGKTLLDYTNLFSTNDYKRNGKIIYKSIKDKYNKTGRKP